MLIRTAILGKDQIAVFLRTLAGILSRSKYTFFANHKEKKASALDNPKEYQSLHFLLRRRLMIRKIAELNSVFAILDKFPVTPLHTLVIPFRHVSDWFDLTEIEREDSEELLASTSRRYSCC